MRDRLIHGYFVVDYDLVWDVGRSRVPELRKQIAAILEAYLMGEADAGSRCSPAQLTLDTLDGERPTQLS